MLFLYLGVVILAGFVVSIFDWIKFFDGCLGYSILEGIFLHHVTIHCKFNDDVNAVGMTIIHAFVAIFTWPTVIFNCIIIGGYGLWGLFLKVFAKKKKEGIL